MICTVVVFHYVVRDFQIQAEKLKKHGANAWLVNTGWVGGGYGMPEGGRIPLKYTRAIVDEIHSGSLMQGDFEVSGSRRPLKWSGNFRWLKYVLISLIAPRR